MGLGGAPMKSNERRARYGAGPLNAGQNINHGNVVTYRGGLRITHTNYMWATVTMEIFGTNVTNYPVCKGGLGFSSPVMTVDVFPLVRIVRARMARSGAVEAGVREPTAFFQVGAAGAAATAILDNCLDVGWQQDLNAAPGKGRACQTGLARLQAGEIPYIDAGSNRIGRIFFCQPAPGDRVGSQVWESLEFFRDDE